MAINPPTDDAVTSAPSPEWSSLTCMAVATAVASITPTIAFFSETGILLACIATNAVLYYLLISLFGRGSVVSMGLLVFVLSTLATVITLIARHS